MDKANEVESTDLLDALSSIWQKIEYLKEQNPANYDQALALDHDATLSAIWQEDLLPIEDAIRDHMANE